MNNVIPGGGDVVEAFKPFQSMDQKIWISKNFWDMGFQWISYEFQWIVGKHKGWYFEGQLQEHFWPNEACDMPLERFWKCASFGIKDTSN